jgi:hypothetical protein
MHLSKEIDHRLLEHHRYLLVDAGYLEDPTQLLPKDWPTLPAVLVRPAHLNVADVDLCPRLVDMQPLTDTQRHDWLQNIHEQSHLANKDGGWYWSAFIDSAYPLEKLAEQLARRMQVLLPLSPSPQLFRFFDPAIMVHLATWLDQVELAWLLFGLNRYTYFFANEWCTLEPSMLDQKQSIDRVGYQLAPILIARLTRLSIVNRTLDFIKELPISQVAWRSLCEELDEAVVRAEHHGLNSREEKIMFALDSHLIGKNFDQHPFMQKKLLQLRGTVLEDELNYFVLRVQLTEQDWEQIKLDLSMESV